MILTEAWPTLASDRESWHPLPLLIGTHGRWAIWRVPSGTGLGKLLQRVRGSLGPKV